MKFHLASWAIVALVLVGLANLAEAGEGDKYDKRCRYFGWLRACKLGCKAMGHTTGACDDSDKCHCSEEDFNFFSDIVQWIGKFDPTEVVSRVVKKFKRKIDDWEMSESIKSLVPSKCQISQEFCSDACQSIGRINGRCNEDFTDCTCADETVSAKQYGLCVVETICKTDCQAKGFARGECRGKGEWDCVCISNKDVEVDNDIPEELKNFEPQEGTEYVDDEDYDPKFDVRDSDPFDA